SLVISPYRGDTMSHVKDTLTVMAELKARLSYPATQQYLETIFRFDASASGGTTQSGVLPSGEVIAVSMKRILENAEAFFLTKDMQKVVEWASKTLDETDSFDLDL